MDHLRIEKKKWTFISIWNSTNLVCIGSEIEKRPEDVIYSIRKGGIIGNHSYSHPRFSQISLEECFEEIEKTDRIIDSIYREAGVARLLKLLDFHMEIKEKTIIFQETLQRGRQKKDF